MMDKNEEKSLCTTCQHFFYSRKREMTRSAWLSRVHLQCLVSNTLLEPGLQDSSVPDIIECNKYKPQNIVK